MGKQDLRIRFFNTYEPVTSIYRDLLPKLVESGFVVEVILSGREYRPGRGKIEDVISSPSIHFRRIPIIGGRRVSPISKVLAAISYMIGASAISLFGRGVDINIFLTQPPMFSVLGPVLRLFRRQEYACQLMDIYPDFAVEMGLLRHGSLTAKWFRRLSRAIWRGAVGVIVIGRCMEDIVLRAGVSRVHVVPNWANEDRIVPVVPEQNELRIEHELENKFVVLYSGNMGRAHSFSSLLEAARQLRSIGGLKFVFIGQGVRRKEVEQAKETNGLKNILILDSQPDEMLRYSQSLGDVHFISLRNEFTGLVVPSKTYSAMAAGRPIIYQGSANGEIARMICDNHIGKVVGIDCALDLVQAIMKYFDNRQLMIEDGRRARQLAEGAAGSGVAVDSYVGILKKICDGL
jgi:glycosyltransferase involved in cell wall biosynthesis